MKAFYAGEIGMEATCHCSSIAQHDRNVHSPVVAGGTMIHREAGCFSPRR